MIYMVFMIDMEAELDKIKTRGCTQLLSCYATLPTIVITFAYIFFIILFWFTVGGSFMQHHGGSTAFLSSCYNKDLRNGDVMG